jgi:hypothetical protein
MISGLALLVIGLVIGSLLGSHVGHMISGGILALLLFHPQTQELREVLIMTYEKASPEIIRTATEALQKP